jgi:hypothetical protein
VKRQNKRAVTGRANPGSRKANPVQAILRLDYVYRYFIEPKISLSLGNFQGGEAIMDKPRKADTAHAIKFLTAFHEASDPWHLFAIKKGLHPPIVARTFPPGSRRDGNTEHWILEHNEDRDIYFAPNPIDVENKRAKKINVTEIRNLWIDLDPVDGQDRSTLVSSLNTDLHKDIPEPTWIIDSGRGPWAFWNLDRARSMHDTKSSSQEHKIHAIQARNKGIVQAFGGKVRGAC